MIFSSSFKFFSACNKRKFVKSEESPTLDPGGFVLYLYLSLEQLLKFKGGGHLDYS